ncbi:MAG: dephospho-CoA kinase [Bacteroidota bacterium]
MKLKIGITGGIGSGKSFVAEIIKASGYNVLDADDIAKNIMQNDPNVKQDIQSAFGQESYNDDKLNTQYLASEVFSSPQNLEIINSIVHPPTINMVHKLMDEELVSKDIVFVESALIFESLMDEELDYVLLITASEELRILRITLRDSSTTAEVMQRMQFQMPEEDKVNLADFVIKNELTEEDLEKKVKFFIQLFEMMTKQ